MTPPMTARPGAEASGDDAVLHLDGPAPRVETSPLSNLGGLRLVTIRELTQRGRSVPYLLSVGFTFVLLAVAILLPQMLSGRAVTFEVGRVGDASLPILAAAEQIAADEVGEDRSFTFDVTTYADEAAARAALEAGDIELVLIDASEIVRQGSTGLSGSDLQDAVQQAAALAALQSDLAGTDLTVDDLASALERDPLPVRTLQGETDAALEEGRSLIAYGGMMLLYFAILGFGAWTLQGVVEEKTSRVVEVLLATLKPWQLLAGKVLGIGLLGLGQFVAAVGFALVLIRLSGALDLPAIPVDSAVTLVAWFILGYAIFSALYAAVGSLVSRSEDAQSVAFPVSMVAIVGFLVSFQALDDPTGMVARVGTYLPPMSPFVVPIRVAFKEIPLWEHLVAAGLSLATVVLLLRLAARIYAGGLLHFGARLRLRQAWAGADRERPRK